MNNELVPAPRHPRLIRLKQLVRTLPITTHAVIRLGFRLATGKPVELWIGDSNTLGYNRRLTAAPLSPARQDGVIWHLGPRLMYTVARAGYPPSVRRSAPLIRFLARRGSLTVFTSAGEIDVRCHLVPRLARPDFSFDFVGQYVARAVTLAESLGASRLVVAVPAPQNASIPRLELFPVRGTIEERVAASEAMREAVLTAVAAADASIEVLALDATDVLTLPDGSYDPTLTADGAHANDRGIARIRSVVDRLLNE